MSKQWENKNIQTLDEITTYNNLFVEIENAAYAATFIGHPEQYAHPWQIVFLPAYNQIWTQGDFYGTNSYEYEATIARLQAQDEALGQAIGDIATYSYITQEMLGNPNDVPQNVTNIENYLYSYISKEIDKLDKELTSSYTSVTYAAYDAANAYVTVSYVHDNDTGTAYTVELHNAAAYSYVQSAYAYIEQQITNINKDITATSVNVITPEKVENKAYLDVTYESVENSGITYTVTLVDAVSAHDMESYVQSAVTYTISYIVNGAPTYFDTLKEIAEWISNDDTGAAAITNEIGYLKDAYTYFTSAYTNTQENFTTLNNAYTYFTNSYVDTQNNLNTLNNAYTYFGEAYTYTLDKFNEIERDSYIYVSYDSTNRTAIHHGGTIVVTGETVNNVSYNYTTGGTARSTGSINDAIAHIESRIRTAESGGITSIISPNNTITATKTQNNDNQYEIDTDANIIPVTTTDNPEYFSTGDSVETALVGIDAQVKTNATDIEAILEALNWTIVGGTTNANP